MVGEKATWFGANDLLVEGQWQWIYDGSLLPPAAGAMNSAYTNWGDGEPSSVVAYAGDEVR